MVLNRLQPGIQPAPQTPTPIPCSSKVLDKEGRFIPEVTRGSAAGGGGRSTEQRAAKGHHRQLADAPCCWTRGQTPRQNPTNLQHRPAPDPSQAFERLWAGYARGATRMTPRDLAAAVRANASASNPLGAVYSAFQWALALWAFHDDDWCVRKNDVRGLYDGTGAAGLWGARGLWGGAVRGAGVTPGGILQLSFSGSVWGGGRSGPSVRSNLPDTPPQNPNPTRHRPQRSTAWQTATASRGMAWRRAATPSHTTTWGDAPAALPRRARALPRGSSEVREAPNGPRRVAPRARRPCAEG
jgi:hypothetical protein